MVRAGRRLFSMSGCRRFVGDDANRASPSSSVAVKLIARLDLAIGIENGDEHHLRRPTADRAEVGADLVTNIAQAMTVAQFLRKTSAARLTSPVSMRAAL